MMSQMPHHLHLQETRLLSTQQLLHRQLNLQLLLQVIPTHSLAGQRESGMLLISTKPQLRRLNPPPLSRLWRHLMLPIGS